MSSQSKHTVHLLVLALLQILDFLEKNGYAIVPLSTLLLPQE